jgi:predicted GTPase
MKSTEINRIDRELRQARKKQETIEKRLQSRGTSVGDYIKRLNALLFHDQRKIYNLKNNAEIQKLFAEMKQNLPAEQWEIVLRKAIRETKVEKREEAFSELKVLLEA